MGEEHRYEIVVRCLNQGFPGLFRLSDLAQIAGLHPDLVRRFLTLGLIEPARLWPEPLFTDEAILRISRILRLRRDMGVNLASAGIILDLLDQIEELKRELDRLRRL
ncbi:MAG: MerR family transcriptional regulator [bacterium]|nr:MerR family transcriptional regulator [bacterium]